MEKDVTFKEISDKTVYNVVDEEGHPVAEITGYDIGVKYNLEKIKTPEDIDAVSAGIADIFKELLISTLLSNNQ